MELKRSLLSAVDRLASALLLLGMVSLDLLFPSPSNRTLGGCRCRWPACSSRWVDQHLFQLDWSSFPVGKSNLVRWSPTIVLVSFPRDVRRDCVVCQTRRGLTLLGQKISDGGSAFRIDVSLTYFQGGFRPIRVRIVLL